MLAAALVLAGALSLLLRLRPASTLALLATSVFVALFGNAHRAASLFLVNVPPEDAAHAAIGVIVFVECAILLVVAAKLLQRRQSRSAQPVRERANAGRTTKTVFLLACVAATIGGFSRNSHTAVAANAATVVWPNTWQGQPLDPMPLPESINEFLSDFPGEWAQFRVGDTGKVALLRRCTVATRKLHPAENCFAALGGTCSPMASLRDEQGHVWSRFRYTDPDGAQRVVSQCYFAIRETAGEPNETQQREDLSDWLRDAPSWPDASAWYWASAVPGSITEMTLALTVAE
jgi:exosortase/archaeosortase family protein